MNSQSKEYKKYIVSKKWKRIRDDMLKLANHRCTNYAKCQNGKTGRLEVHHLNYDRLGCELPSDLAVYCSDCHPAADRHRDVEIRLRTYERGYDTYMTKKYGRDHYRADGRAAREEHEDWLRNKSQSYGY